MTPRLNIVNYSRFGTAYGIMLEGRMRQNEIFQEGSCKFFDCFAVCYYHVSTKLPEITKCYST